MICDNIIIIIIIIITTMSNIILVCRHAARGERLWHKNQNVDPLTRKTDERQTRAEGVSPAVGEHKVLDRKDTHSGTIWCKEKRCIWHTHTDRKRKRCILRGGLIEAEHEKKATAVEGSAVVCTRHETVFIQLSYDP